MKKLILFVLIFGIQFSIAQKSSGFSTSEIEINPLIKGTLFTPEKDSRHLVIMIAGSGPTNRSGNQIGAINNSLKLLSEAMAGDGISVFSYDKRIFALMIQGNLKEEELSFEDLINDAIDVINHFKSQKKYSKIIVAGHSEGSLIGMIAAKNRADGFISLAGAGSPLDEVLLEQIGKQAPVLKESATEKIAMLKAGKTFALENQMLASIFRESVQPYLISLFKYEPKTEIAKLKIPVLIINGTKDIQVTEAEASKLHQAKPDAKMVIIPDMNHILKVIAGDDAENRASYSNPDLPVSKDLALAVNQFIKSI